MILHNFDLHEVVVNKFLIFMILQTDLQNPVNLKRNDLIKNVSSFFLIV